MQSELSARATPGVEGWSDARRTCLKDAVRRLGADDETARIFADSGCTFVEGLALHVLPLGSHDGPWAACMKLPRPDGIDAGEWSEALLLANGHALMLQDWAFALEQDGAGVLVMVLKPGVPDEHDLAAWIEGMHVMCQCVLSGVGAMRELRAEERALS